MKDIALTSKVCIVTKPNSTSKIFSIIDSYPCVLEFEMVLQSTTKKRGNRASEIRVINDSDRSRYVYTTQSILFKVLNDLAENVVIPTR